MALLTTPSDVESRLGRSLRTPDETELADTLIEDAERMVAKQTPGGDLTTLDVLAIKQVVGGAVARVLRNPDGYRSETAGGLTVTIDSRVAAGFLTFLDEDWTLLGLTAPSAKGGAFSFGPMLAAPPAPAWTGWSDWC